ncbi:helix-turn-helix domain-containing protein [Candidatus Bipolaricaulota bacterium]|nr:helix-turn-helix domain-containing protein [Candidatus Bipolaricaulota bacterium]TFH10984.1 MAG: helix-turn-helix domain-containing protein [Candidatus Atribacteria bacterium]
MATFGERIRDLRQEQGLTQWQVANHTGVSNTYISALESGRKPAPPHAIVTALASCLQVSEDTLWDLARTERENRLRRRIDGIPTSKRTNHPLSVARVETEPDASSALLDQAMQSLRASAKNPKQRRTLADALEALGKSLRWNS